MVLAVAVAVTAPLVVGVAVSAVAAAALVVPQVAQVASVAVERVLTAGAVLVAVVQGVVQGVVAPAALFCSGRKGTNHEIRMDRKRQGS